MIKGIGMLPVVTAFQAERAAMALLADAPLEPYLECAVDVHEWYPAQHMIDMLKLIARVNLPELGVQPAFEFFGSVAAQRDLQGVQDAVYKSHRTEAAGWYRGAVTEQHRPADYLRRAFGLYQLYYDQGEFRLTRMAERVVEAELVGQPTPIAEFCMITTGFARELQRVVKAPGKIELTACRAFGDARCTWTVSFDEGVDVSSLELLQAPPVPST
jgi:hypothetical protein